MTMSTAAVMASRAVAPSRILCRASHTLRPAPHRLEGGQGVAQEAGVVDAQHVGAADGGGQAGADGGRVPVFDRLAGELAEEALARRADHDRAADGRRELPGAGEQRDVLVETLAEADARVDDGALPQNGRQRGDTLGERARDLLERRR